MTDKQNSKLNFIGASVSIVSNILLFFIKIWAGIISGSVALVADAWHSLSDTLSSIVLLIGIKLSLKKPNSKYPYGQGRWEQITAIFIAFFLGFVAYEILKESIFKFSNKELPNFGFIAYAAIILSIISKEALAQMSYYISRKTGSSAMKADGWHHRSDALSSCLILVGIFFQKYFWWIDSLLGVFIAIVLFYAVYKIIKEAISNIMGENIDSKTKKAIIDIIKELNGTDLSAHHFHIHTYGNHKELTFHIRVNPCYTVKDAHDIAYRIEKEIFNRTKILSTIHVEPEE